MKLFESGHRACAGCAEPIAVRAILEVLGKDVIVVNPTGCLEIVSSCYPESAWGVPYIHSLFENGPAVASGIARALRAKGNDHTRVVCIGGDGACYSIDTKILTSEGFKYVNEIKPGDLVWSVNPETLTLELQPVRKLHTYLYEGKMIRAKTRYIDFLVTPNHSIPILRRNKNGYSSKISFITAKDLLRRYRSMFPRTFHYVGKNSETFTLPTIKKKTSEVLYKSFDMKDWLQFIGWYVTEGCCYYSKSGYLVRIYQSNKEKRREILKLTRRMGLHSSECNRSVDISSKQLYTYLKENCGDHFYNKRIPREFLDLSPDYLQILFDTLIKGDGCRLPPSKGRKMDRIAFTTKSHYLLSNFVEICLKLGMNCSLFHGKDGVVVIRVHRKHVKNELYSKRKFGGKLQVFEEEYAGLVCCPELPKNHTLIIERNGKISLSGNSYDIGFGSFSGALERNEDVIFACLDTECYSNTGVQRSGATPHFAATTTSPVGRIHRGKEGPRKHIGLISAAHNIPYAASASVGNIFDLKRKVEKAKDIRGSSFILVHTPCNVGWRFPPNLTIEVARLAIETGAWKLYEFENGKLTLNYEPKFTPVEEYLKIQGRFKHLTKEEIEKIQKEIISDWNALKIMEKIGKEEK
jgi:pyruvate/2-oxoacid:ferredoxin oxidoreductase beta subunit